jgi:hypothetical protein
MQGHDYGEPVPLRAPDWLGFFVPGDMRVQRWVSRRQTAAGAAGAAALAEVEAAHVAANPAGV